MAPDHLGESLLISRKNIRLIASLKLLGMCMTVDLPAKACAFGFETKLDSRHTSRTMMLAGMWLLLDTCLSEAGSNEYRRAIVEDNVLLKETATTRLRSLCSLCEPYALDSNILAFREQHDLRADSSSEQPILASLCAVARNSLLGAIVPFIQRYTRAYPRYQRCSLTDMMGINRAMTVYMIYFKKTQVITA